MKPLDTRPPDVLAAVDDELVVDGPTTFPVGRRDFVKLTGLLVLVATNTRGDQQEPSRPPQGYPTDVNAYLHIGADGRVTCFVGKIEMGQGAMTSLSQLLADELDVPLASVAIVMGDTDRCPWDMGTFGSLSVRQFGPVLRQAGAEARAALLDMAAERLKVPAERLAVKDGVIRDTTDAKASVTYGQLTEGRRIERTLTSKPALRPVSALTVVGQSPRRMDAIDKVTGRAKYAGDVVPPGDAVHARILRPPSHGATLVSADTSAAEARAGVRVIRDGDTIAVLHAHRDEADAALALVKSEWQRHDPPLDEETIFEHFRRTATAVRTVAQGGDLAEGERRAATVLERTYYDSYFAHAPMEPHAAVAAFEGGKLTVWAGTQTPFPLKNQLVQALRLAPERVRVITPYVGGGFGGKSASRQGVEAARLAMLAKRPVRVQWSREEEFFYDTFRPASIVRVRAGVDAGGKLTSWDYEVYCAGERGAAQFYDIPNHRTVSRGAAQGAAGAALHPFGTGAWRAPGVSTNTFGRESHIDAIASRAAIDPIAFRLQNLKDPRMIRVLQEAAKRFGWTARPSPSRRGLGVACGTDTGSVVALIAEVTVDTVTGAVRVTRLVCAQEMGLVVNPVGAMQQIEGCLTMGLGYSLSEQVRFKGGEVLTRNFDAYELPRFSSVPQIDAVIVDARETPAQGGGEPAIVPVGAAIANAIFDATGARLYRMPMTPARVLEALRLARTSG
jgi:nicotinate dehydrogenase subunit B